MSDTEVRLGAELAEFFTVELHQEVVVEGKRWVVDILLPADGVAVEFDGSRWHQGKDEVDLRKSGALAQAGLRVIRLREAPLEPLGAWNVVVPQYASVHALTVAVLEQVEAMHSGEVGGLGRYRDDRRTRADEKADSEIDRIAAEVGPQGRAARAAVLDRIFGRHNWRQYLDGHLLFLPSGRAEERAAHLDKLLRGRDWRKQPGLLNLTPATLDRNAAHLDELLRGRDWRGQPSLLGRDGGALDRNAAYLDELLQGREWRKQPGLLGSDPATLDRNAAHLDELLRGREWRTQPNPLTSDPATLDRNALLLTNLTGGERWQASSGLLAYSPHKVWARMALLTGALGNEEARNLVRRYPTYLGYPTWRLNARINRILAQRA